LHTDAPGAPLTVIKTEGEEVPQRTLLEAAQFAVSYSSIWKAGLAAGDCYLIGGDQVTKTPEHGEFLKKAHSSSAGSAGTCGMWRWALL